MLSDDTCHEPRASVSKNAPDSLGSIPTDGIAPELDSVSSAALPTYEAAAKQSAPLIFGKTINLEDLFVTQHWHRPYAEALLETNPSDLPDLIAAAERAIIERYFELQLNPVSTDELVDLGHAVEALSQIKKNYQLGDQSVPM